MGTFSTLNQTELAPDLIEDLNRLSRTLKTCSSGVLDESVLALAREVAERIRMSRDSEGNPGKGGSDDWSTVRLSDSEEGSASGILCCERNQSDGLSLFAEWDPSESLGYLCLGLGEESWSLRESAEGAVVIDSRNPEELGGTGGARIREYWDQREKETLENIKEGSGEGSWIAMLAVGQTQKMN